jgi:DNA-binding transcriptional ArsR family regulator
MKVRAERHAETRRRILEAAVHLNGTVGPHPTTISDIARLAGVERPTVLRHLRDRFSLVSRLPAISSLRLSRRSEVELDGRAAHSLIPHSSALWKSSPRREASQLRRRRRWS